MSADSEIVLNVDDELKRVINIIKGTAIYHLKHRDSLNQQGDHKRAMRHHQRGVSLITQLYQGNNKPFIYKKDKELPVLVTCCYNMHVLSLNDIAMFNLGIYSLKSINAEHCTCQPCQG